MGVYIKGMEMPESGTYKVSIDKTTGKDKTVISMFVRGEGELICCGVYEVVPVPPHGRLIDADALKAEFPEPNEANGGWRNPDEAIVHKTGVWACIDCAPTIIQAEEGE